MAHDINKANYAKRSDDSIKYNKVIHIFKGLSRHFKKCLPKGMIFAF